MLQEISDPDEAGTGETPLNVAEEEVVVNKGGQLRLLGGKAPDILTYPHSRPAKSTGIGENPLTGVQNQPHVHGSLSSHQK